MGTFPTSIGSTVRIFSPFVILLCSIAVYSHPHFLACPNPGAPVRRVKQCPPSVLPAPSLCIKKYTAAYVRASSRQSCCPCSSRSPQHLQLLLCAPQSLIKALPPGPSLHFPNTCIFCLLRHLLRQPPLALQPCPAELPSTAAVPKPVSLGPGRRGGTTGLPAWLTPGQQREGHRGGEGGSVLDALKSKGFLCEPRYCQLTMLSTAVLSPVSGLSLFSLPTSLPGYFLSLFKASSNISQSSPERRYPGPQEVQDRNTHKISVLLGICIVVLSQTVAWHLQL